MGSLGENRTAAEVISALGQESEAAGCPDWLYGWGKFCSAQPLVSMPVNPNHLWGSRQCDSSIELCPWHQVRHQDSEMAWNIGVFGGQLEFLGLKFSERLPC